MSAEEQLAALKAELDAERQKSTALQEANSGLKSQLNNQTQKNEVQKSELEQCKKWNVELQTLSEQEEENITNKLIKRLTGLKREKEALAMQVEAEEEFLTNGLQVKLEKMRQEKVDLEVELGQEQEKIFNQLHKQLSSVKAEKETLEMQLSEGSSELLEALQASVIRLKNDETFQAAEHKAQLLELMMREIDALKITNANTEQERVDYRSQHSAATAELVQLRRDNAGLQQKASQEHKLLMKVASEKAALELEREEELEKLYNLGAHLSTGSSGPIFDYVRNRSGSVSSQDSCRSSGPTARYRSTSCSSPISGQSTRSSTRSSTPYEKRERTHTKPKVGEDKPAVPKKPE